MNFSSLFLITWVAKLTFKVNNFRKFVCTLCIEVYYLNLNLNQFLKFTKKKKGKHVKMYFTTFLNDLNDSNTNL